MCDKQMYRNASFTPIQCYACGRYTLFPDWKEEDTCQHCGKLVKREKGGS